MQKMIMPKASSPVSSELLDLVLTSVDQNESLGCLFNNCVAYLDYTEGSPGVDGYSSSIACLTVSDLQMAGRYLTFGKAVLSKSLDDPDLTHVVVSKLNGNRPTLIGVRRTLSKYLIPLL